MNASDPTTSPEILAMLAKSPEIAVLKAVATNPNTPEKVLNKLWKRFPAAMLANPILTLWEFGSPGDLRKKISSAAKLASYNHLRKTGADLLDSIHSPESLKQVFAEEFGHNNRSIFQQAPQDPLVERRLFFLHGAWSSSSARFFHRYAPLRVWRSLANDSHPAVRQRFAEQLVEISREVKKPNSAFNEAVRTLAQSNDHGILQKLANCPPIPADVVQRLAQSDSIQIRRSLATCKNTPLECVERLCKDPEETVRQAFACHSRLARAHELLLEDPSPNVRTELARNRSVKLDFLSRFDPHDHPSVLMGVFLNRNSDEKIRMRIFQDHPEVAKIITSDGYRLTPRFYFACKNHISEDLRRGLSKRNGLDVAIAFDLAGDPVPAIRLTIAHRLRGQYCWRDTRTAFAMLERFANDPDQEIRHFVCTDYRLTGKLVAQLARDPEPEIRLTVLEHLLQRLEKLRNCGQRGSYAQLYHFSVGLFLEAAKDPSLPVRSTLAAAKETPPGALGILFDDPDENVRTAARSHTLWPFGAVLDFEKNHPRFGGPSRHGDTTPSLGVLRIFAKSPNAYLRQATARYSRTGIPELRILAQDSHPAVRETALVRLAKSGTDGTLPPLGVRSRHPNREAKS